MLWTGRTGRAASDDKPAADAGYDPDTDRKNAAEILTRHAGSSSSTRSAATPRRRWRRPCSRSPAQLSPLS